MYLCLAYNLLFQGKSLRMMGVPLDEVDKIRQYANMDMRIAGFKEEEKRLMQRALARTQALKLPPGPYIFCDFQPLKVQFEVFQTLSLIFIATLKHNLKLKRSLCGLGPYKSKVVLWSGIPVQIKHSIYALVRMIKSEIWCLSRVAYDSIWEPLKSRQISYFVWLVILFYLVVWLKDCLVFHLNWLKLSQGSRITKWFNSGSLGLMSR